MRYNLITFKNAIIKEPINNKTWQGCVEKGILVHCWWECRLVQPLWKQYGVSSKLKNGTALWPSHSTSRNLSEETQNSNLKEYMHPYVHCRVIYNSQDLEAAQVSISRQVDNTTMGHLHNGILLSCKKKEKFTLSNCMNGPGEHYAKWNKPVIDRQIPHDFSYTWSLMNKILTNKRLIDTENRLTALRGDGDRARGTGWKKWQD